MRTIHSAVALTILAFLLAGCGAGSDAETAANRPSSPSKPNRPSPPSGQNFQVTLDGYPNAENVGILLAKQRGYFAEAGLDIEVYYPVTTLNVFGYVGEKAIDVGISHQPELVMEKEKGRPIVAVGSLLKRPTMAMIWLKKSKIRGIADLKGRTIATVALPFERDFLRSVLARGGLTLDDVKLKHADYALVPDLAEGRVDAIFGGSPNVDGVELEARGLEPVITRVQSLGIPAYDELVLLARRDRLTEDPRSIRKFIGAMNRGTAAAIADPEAAAEAIAAGKAELEPGYRPDPELAKAEAEATLPFLSETARMSSKRARRLVDWMYDEGMIRRKLPASALLTNRYLTP